MALSGLDIYKHLAKTNCRECGFPTCLAFAMALAKKQTSLEKCKHVSEEARMKLESASLPPMRLIKLGAAEKEVEIGNETVMFRHEEKFYHPAAIGFLLEDSLDDSKFKEKLERINRLKFERVGQLIEVNIIAIKQTKDAGNFVNKVKLASQSSDLAIMLVSDDAASLGKALELLKNKKPIIYSAKKNNLEAFARLAKESGSNLVVSCDNLSDMSELTAKINSLGVSDLILDTGSKPLVQKIQELTQLRRLALIKSFRPFGYPNMVLLEENDLFRELSAASTLLAKYANILIIKNFESWEVLSLLTLRQNIYTDPQKPLQVEPKIYPVGTPGEKSPFLVTTNFSLTYYTVLSEVESSKVASYIMAVDTEGMSVLTAWAAEKFNAEVIAKALEKQNAKDVVKHNRVVIPGYVAAMSGDLEEKSNWKVLVGPREAAGITNYLRNLG
ncbi:MAG TPA: acetyl-CoA decarbonylase/synthase complex subunit gamma [Candidatus Omnitrophota bacterium]|nr:acetyl-CoA decarbonylase/synthase complex subunit gamma [Candidatus Omnitrophota bacterium]